MNKEDLSLSSRFQFGDKVVVNLGTAGTIFGEICGVIFEPGIIFYDVKLYPFEDEIHNKDMFVILNRVRSFYIEEPLDRFKKPQPNGYIEGSNVGLKIIQN